MKEIEIQMFNHGVFQEKLQEELERIHSLQKKEKDPYALWNLNDQKKLLEKILVIYKQSVDTQLNR